MTELRGAVRSPARHDAPGPRLSHVDGLRAIAVVAVLLYHFGVPGAPNGFLGVDIFLVISGYVISRSLTAAPMKPAAPVTRTFIFFAFPRLRPRRPAASPSAVALPVSLLSRA